MMENKKGNNEKTDENSKQLKILIEALTHSGSNTVDEKVLKNIKNICKSSEIYISEAYNLLLQQLKKKNSQIRSISFLICKELFKRSALFRELFINDLELVYKLTAEINSKNKLPPPKSAAQNLKLESLKTLQFWVNEYGEAYKKLKIAFNYFKNCHNVNFETFQVLNAAELERQNECEIQKRARNEEKIKKLIEEVKGYESEIESTITSLSNCLNLLLPSPEDFFISETHSSVSYNSNYFDDNSGCSNFTNKSKEVQYNDLRSFGLTKNYSLLLEVNPNKKFNIQRTEENSSIIENAKDCVQLIINRFLPLIKKWCDTCTTCSNGDNQELKKLLNLREKLTKVVDKYNKLNIEGNSISEKYENNSSDDEFEEVKKEGYEDTVELTEEDLLEINHLQNISVTEQSNIQNNSKMSLKECSSSKDEQIKEHTSSKQSSSPITSRKSKLMMIAPKVPYDIDLYHWEDETLSVPTLISSKMDVDKFWGCSESDDLHEIRNPEGIAALRTRVIEFTGKFEAVKWSCRAPLPSGKLCPRMDRIKCPFHGKIIPRDETGKKCEGEKSNDVFNKPSIPDWQNPDLLADLKASTGVDLKMPEGKGKKRKLENENLTHKKMKTSRAALKIVQKKNFPGLIDVIRKQKTSYSRLSKKIFNKSSLKRVCATLDKIDKKKYLDKFGDCFNYL